MWVSINSAISHYYSYVLRKLYYTEISQLLAIIYTVEQYREISRVHYRMMSVKHE